MKDLPALHDFWTQPDVRRCLSWVRSQGATATGMHGVSLGGYTAAILAGLEHPNIARMYDTGVTADGRPWLAMEPEVSAMPITPLMLHVLMAPVIMW